MPSARFFAALAAILLSLVVTTRARAQSITVLHESSLARVDQNGQQIPKRPLTVSPEAINLQDCRDDQRIRLSVQMTGFMPNAVVQAWASAGADCSFAQNREGERPACWNVVEAVPLQQNVDVDVPVRALLSRTADESACGTVDLTRIELHLMMFAGADEPTAIATKRLEIVADTIGPRAPRAKVFPGNGRARIEIQPAAELQTLTTVTAYCEKSTSPSACSAVALVPGAEPDPARECGTIVQGGSGSVFFTDPLANGENHVVAVAARDAFGNLGPLSNVTCATPSPDAETTVESLDEPTGCAVGTPGGHARGALAFDVAGVAAALALVLARVVVRRRHP